MTVYMSVRAPRENCMSVNVLRDVQGGTNMLGCYWICEHRGVGSGGGVKVRTLAQTYAQVGQQWLWAMRVWEKINPQTERLYKSRTMREENMDQSSGKNYK